MELGNFLFGNSRGKYLINKTAYVEAFGDFIDEARVDTINLFSRYGAIDNHFYIAERNLAIQDKEALYQQFPFNADRDSLCLIEDCKSHKIRSRDVYDMLGGLVSGKGDLKEHAPLFKENHNSLECLTCNVVFTKEQLQEHIWQKHRVEFLENNYWLAVANVYNKIQPYIKVIESKLEYSNLHIFENEVFSMSNYYWGDEDTIKQRPNFIYKPTDFSISWYKYPLRDSYSNQKISLKEFKKILQHCRDSLTILNSKGS